MTVNISRTHSKREQICRICGRSIPAHEESIKTTKTICDQRSISESWYTCKDCELVAVAKEATK